MPRVLLRPMIVAIALALLPAAGLAAEADSFLAEFRKFAGQHCVGCHGPQVQTRKLRLDQLALSLDDRDVAATWVKVLTRMSKGDMPPKGKPRPPEQAASDTLAKLQGQLHAASLSRQQREGRVVLRRLNRVEYETTLRDLLAITANAR